MKTEDLRPGDVLYARNHKAFFLLVSVRPVAWHVHTVMIRSDSRVFETSYRRGVPINRQLWGWIR